MTNPNPVPKLYRSIIDDVVNGCREIFLDEGIDEQVLHELKQMWENKLKCSKSVDNMVEEQEHVISTQLAVQQQQQQQQQIDIGKSGICAESGCFWQRCCQRAQLKCQPRSQQKAAESSTTAQLQQCCAHVCSQQLHSRAIPPANIKYQMLYICFVLCVQVLMAAEIHRCCAGTPNSADANSIPFLPTQFKGPTSCTSTFSQPQKVIPSINLTQNSSHFSNLSRREDNNFQIDTRQSLKTDKQKYIIQLDGKYDSDSSDDNTPRPSLNELDEDDDEGNDASVAAVGKEEDADEGKSSSSRSRSQEAVKTSAKGRGKKQRLQSKEGASVAPAHTKDDLAEKDADELEAEENASKVLVEEDPLNSGDDVTDEEVCELFDSDNLIVCQFEKITRSRNKWKFYFKDGIMNVNGRDYIFQKALGDAEW